MIKRSKTFYLIVISLILGAYYIYIGIYLNKLGYNNQESLFYIEKAKILLTGLGDRLQVMGLTAPFVPFYASLLFSLVSNIFAPILASAVGTALLFYIMASSMAKRNKDNFYTSILFVLFVLHPGLIYTACSGKSVYLILIFFFLFFLNLLKFYNSNTTFHVSIASICYVLLIFCDYKFVWLSLFFIPLVLSISIHTLNLGEKESVFRLFISFNNPSLRRKLINKTFSIYTIIFALPLASMVIYKVLNLTHAGDSNYFIDSPYATWNIIAEHFEYKASYSDIKLPEISVLVSLKALVFCPLILLAIYLFKQNTYQILTLLIPFGLIEFLKIKYEKVNLVQQYYLIFLMLAILCIMFRARFVRDQRMLKLGIAVIVLVQLYIGYIFLSKSPIYEESYFVDVFLHRTINAPEEENHDIASYINTMPDNTQILADDAVAYPILSYIDNIRLFTMPYQQSYLSAVESPEKYSGYILIANVNNPMIGYTQLTEVYLAGIRRKNPNLNMFKIYVTDNWTLYKLLPM